ncbi:hypothetical protein ACFSQ7_32315 [Paenibacillus rhizoplanae]
MERYYNAPQAVWKLSPVTPFPVKKNLEAFRELETFRRTGDASVLQDEAKTIQKRIAAYEAGGADSETGWGWERTYGPSGAFFPSWTGMNVNLSCSMRASSAHLQRL